MGMFAFCMGFLVVFGTVGHIEHSVSINVTLVVIQLMLGFFLMYIGHRRTVAKKQQIKQLTRNPFFAIIVAY